MSVSKYNFQQKLGSGSFGTVWLSVEKATGKKFAIKEVQDYNPETTDVEVAILKTIQHVSIIKYFESFYAPNTGKFYIVLDYADEGTLESHVTNGSHNTKEYNIWRFVAHVSDALRHLHSLKPVHVLHRDIKPANVLGMWCQTKSSHDWEICWKLADFGLAKMLTLSAQKRYYTSSFVGTPIYMAPEVFEDFTSYSFPADIWSTGALISFYCNGRHLFSSEDSVRNWDLKSHSMPKYYSEGLKTLVRRMLDPDTKGRPSAEAVNNECFVGNRQK